MNDPRYRDADAIFRAAIARVDPIAMTARVFRVDRDTLHVVTEQESATYDLGSFGRIVVTGMGKATARMALGLERLLGDRIETGVISVKTGHTERLQRIRTIEAAHPVPDASSVKAADAILDFAERLDAGTLVITLISGGGSALACAPRLAADPSARVTLEDKQEVTRALLRCGATIHEINCVRKHLSRIKGGWLARAYAPATSLNLMLSDVVGDDLDVIASGPTVPDPTTFADALGVLERCKATVPPAVGKVLEAGAAGTLEETPKRSDPAFSKVRNILVGTNYQALLAANDKANELGYNTMVLTSRLTGEAREAALALLGIAEDIATRGSPLRPPACLIAGGETTVTVRGTGKGGRNQEMALAFLSAMRRSNAAQRIVFLAASTDGNDGPTDAAGAFASLEIGDRARDAGLDPNSHLATNDSYNFHERTGSLYRTGPTNTNVSDVAIALIR